MYSNPLLQDSDGDGISDEEELLIGTNPLLKDTDSDGLEDGFELSMWYDPLQEDADGDGRWDLQEYEEGTDPFCYDKDWHEHVWDFICGAVAGDFIKDTDSLPTMIGQISSSFIPFIDIRDVAGNLVHGDFGFAGLSALGLVPVAGDITKAVSKVGKFAVKNIDDVPKVIGLLSYLNKNLPDVAKGLGKSDDFVDAAKKLSKLDNIKLTRKQAKILSETLEAAGMSEYLIKTSTKLDIKRTLDVASDLWEKGALKRGKEIDEILNAHSLGKGLGEFFPVADRLEDMALISTKSLDIGAQSYQNVNTLQRTLNRYADSLKNFESKYFKGLDEFTWKGKTITKNQYNKKALEIVLPDIVINENTLEVLNNFKKTMDSSGFEVWYIIGK